MSGEPVAAAATEAVQADAQEVGFKVFVGNLSFATKDAELQEIFEAVGPISNASIINRGQRSLGYGFVTFATEADAQNAIARLDKSEVAGRQINVELAKPPTATPAGRAPREPKAAAASAEGAAPIDGGVKTKKPRPKRPKAARRARTDGETEEAGDAPADVNDVTAQLASATLDGEAPKPKGRRGAPREPGTAPVRRGPPTGEPSKTLLFVANLPFSVTDEGLSTLFADYQVASARVVVKKFGPGQGRSKGFGFVDFLNEEEQKKALENVQGQEVDGREVQLKVAINAAPEAVSEEAKTDVEPEAIIVAS